MPAREARPRSRASLRSSLVGLLSGLLLVTGCTMSPAPTPVPSATPTPTRPFTVMSTDPIRTADPAAVSDQGSAMLNLNVFQRLMTTDPGQNALKPDAARDCVYTATTVYTCTLNQESRFHNGHALTSSDVRFSILRARRLAVPGSSTSMLSSLVRVETPDPLTVRFVLRRIDTQFGFALAGPAASIVDEEAYAPDRLQTLAQPVVGSGPFAVTSLTAQRVVMTRYEDYIGKNRAQTADLTYLVAADSAAIEAAVVARSIDVAGRGLSTAALARFQGQAGRNGNQTVDAGYRIQTQTGTRIRQLQWSAQSLSRITLPMRSAVETALQADRTSDSVVPGGVIGHVGAFPVGGRPRPDVSWTEPVDLTLGYDPTSPDGRDVADLVRARIEATKGFRVQLRAALTGADLAIVDRKAWTATPGSWLQPYLVTVPPATSSVVQLLWTSYIGETAESEALAGVAALQRQAAIDSTVLPFTQSDETFLVRDDATLPVDSFGPGWQLGFFWMRGA